MSLSDTAIRKAKPKAKPFKLADGGGLYLLVQPSGSKWWRYKYRFAGKEKLLALGSYPGQGQQHHLPTLATSERPKEKPYCGLAAEWSCFAGRCLPLIHLRLNLK